MEQYARDNSEKTVPLPTEYKESPTEHDVRVLHTGDPSKALDEYLAVLDMYETHGGGVLPGSHKELRSYVQELQKLKEQGVTADDPRYQKLIFAATSLANYLDVHNKAVPYSFPPVT